ncbi:MAG: choice-of-anchor Q domain-containing protein [Pseudomonadota bacterium]
MTMSITNGLRARATEYLSLFPRLCKLSVLLIGLSTGTSAYAVTLNVNATNDGTDANPSDRVCQTTAGGGTCTLRAAIQEASANDSLSNIIILPAGVYLLALQGTSEDLSATGDLDITKDLTIIGADRATTIIDANDIDRVFHILGGATVNISGVTIKNGYINNSVGGGLYNANGTVTLDHVMISDNIADNLGGLNNAGTGGGIFNSGTLTLTASTISGNAAETQSQGIGGGGIYNEATLRVEDSNISGNHANGSGAGGGGLQNTGGTGLSINAAKATIINTTFSSNSATIGGGVRNLFGIVNLELSTLNNNSAATSGGGIENSGGGMIIGRSSVHTNTSGFTGGGVANFASMDLSHSAVYDNTASLQGGGIYNSGQAALSLINTTVTDNTAGIEGGGIYNHRAANITNSTIYNNLSAGRPGSEIYACGTKDETKNLTCTNDSSQVKTNVINSIIGNNSNPATAACGGELTLITSKGYNIDTGTSCGFTQSTDKSSIAASTFFSPSGFTNNGGTTLTYEILNGSVAHNTGDTINCPVIDQRSKLRDNLCDIGAYEISNSDLNFQLVDLKVVVEPNVATAGGSAQVTFTVTVTNKGPSQATNVILKGKLPSWGRLQQGSISTNNSGGSCTVTSETSFECNMGTINAYANAQTYVVVIPTQAGQLIMEVDVTSDQIDTFRPDSGNATPATVPVVSGTAVGGPDGGNNFSGKGGGGVSDVAFLGLLLLPMLRRFAQRH